MTKYSEEAKKLKSFVVVAVISCPFFDGTVDRCSGMFRKLNASTHKIQSRDRCLFIMLHSPTVRHWCLSLKRIESIWFSIFTKSRLVHAVHPNHDNELSDDNHCRRHHHLYNKEKKKTIQRRKKERFYWENVSKRNRINSLLLIYSMVYFGWRQAFVKFF